MGFLCLECFKKKYPNSEYLNEYGFFDCIDDFYDNEELQDLFIETESNLIENLPVKQIRLECCIIKIRVLT